MSKPVPVTEIFGPVLQGEGKLIGRQTYFIRLGGCDYNCSWCDTPGSVDPALVKANAEHLTVDQILARLPEQPNGRWVTLSGGNPAIFELSELVTRLAERGYQVAAETQGSIAAKWLGWIDLVTVSPKPPSSGMTPKFKLAAFKAILELWPDPDVVVKVPIANEADLKWFKVLLETIPTTIEVFVQPVRNALSTDPTEDKIITQLQDLRTLANAVMRDPTLGRVTVLPQLHALLGMR